MVVLPADGKSFIKKVYVSAAGHAAAIVPLTTQDDMLQDSGQAGALTKGEALKLAAAEILKWGETDDWRARAPARRIFAIYDRVRSD